MLTISGLACAVVIFVWSPLFARVRLIYPPLLNCAMCIGFWVGLIGAHNFAPACIVSVLAFTIDRLLRLTDAAFAYLDKR